MYRKSIREKRILALIAVVLFVVGGIGTAYGLQALGDSHSGNLVDATPIGNSIHSVYGWNGTTYEPAILTISSAGVVTAEFPENFTVQHVVVFTNNTALDIQGILNSSRYYSTLNVKLAETSSTGTSVTPTVNVSSVTEEFGTQVNDSSLNHESDKAINSANSFTSLNVYNSNVNELNKSMAFSIFGLASAPYTDMYGIVMNLNGTMKAGNSISLEITQNFEAPYSFNLIEIFSDMFVVESLVAVGLIILGLPKQRGR